MAAKIIGYIIAIIGVIVVAASLFEQVRSLLTFLPEAATTTILLIVGAILLIIGIFIIIKGSKAKQKTEEVPIYEGEKVVGYRKQ